MTADRSGALSPRVRFWRRVERYSRAIGHRARLLQEADRARRDGHRLPARLTYTILRTPYLVDRYLDLTRFIDARRPITLIDVGGNDGSWAERFLSFFPSAHVIAFEPGPFAEEYRARFRGNPRVEMEQAAVGSEAGSATITLAGMLSSFYEYTAGSHMAAELEAMPATRQVTVPVVRLADYVTRLPSSDATVILKIDTQGHEVPALEGAAELLDRVDVALVETTLSHEYQGNPPALAAVVTLLSAHGLLPTFFASVGQLTSPHPLEQDVIFVREAKVDRLRGW